MKKTTLYRKLIHDLSSVRVGQEMKSDGEAGGRSRSPFLPTMTADRRFKLSNGSVKRTERYDHEKV